MLLKCSWTYGINQFLWPSNGFPCSKRLRLTSCKSLYIYIYIYIYIVIWLNGLLKIQIWKNDLHGLKVWTMIQKLYLYSSNFSLHLLYLHIHFKILTILTHHLQISNIIKTLFTFFSSIPILFFFSLLTFFFSIINPRRNYPLGLILHVNFN